MTLMRAWFSVWLVATILWLATLLLFPNVILQFGFEHSAWLYYGPPLVPLIVGHFIKKLFRCFRYEAGHE